MDGEGEGEGEGASLLESLVKTANDITLIGGFRPSHKRECLNVVRRVRLMLPFFEELKESQEPLPEVASPVFDTLEKALKSAKLMLEFCRDGSKLYLVLESEAIANRFYAVTEDMDKAFDEMPWDLLDASEEVREQVTCSCSGNCLLSIFEVSYIVAKLEQI